MLDSSSIGIGDIFGLLFAVFLVFLNGFFVAAEFAMVKVRSTRIVQLVNEGNKRAKFAQHVTSKLDAYLSACQLGITLSSLGLGYIAEPAIASLLIPLLDNFASEALVHPIAFIITFSLITFSHIVLGELAPKSLAIQKSESTILWISAPLIFFHKLFYPMIVILNGTANAMVRWIGIEPPTDNEGAHTEEEIRMLVNQSHQSGMIDKAEMVLFDNIFDFTNRIAREIMVPRTEMVCFYTDNTFDENFAIAREEKYTRFPLCHDDKDNIVGIVNTKDIYQEILSGKTPDLLALAYEVVTVHETMEIKDVLRMLQKNKSHLAIVIDEYGGTSGMLTVEDIIEEIVGEIQDEYDDERPTIEKKGDAVHIDAHLLIEEVNEYFNLTIDDNEMDTIGGWMFSQIEGTPSVGDVLYYEDCRFEITETDNLRVVRIAVTREEKPSEELLLQVENE